MSSLLHVGFNEEEAISRFVANSKQIEGLEEARNRQFRDIVTNCLSMTASQEPISPELLASWHAKLYAPDGSSGNVKEGKAEELGAIIERVNECLIGMARSDTPGLVTLIADTIHDLEKLQPFGEQENGHVARLVSLYISNWFGRFFMAYQDVSPEEYRKGVSSRLAAKLFFAEKIKDVVKFDDIMDVYLQRVSTKGASCEYGDEKEGGLIVHYHDLEFASRDWKKLGKK